MNNRRMTLGPMSASATNSRGNVATIVPNSQAALVKRMSLAVAAPPAGVIAAVPGPSRRMSMGTTLPPPLRNDSVGITT